MKNTLAALLLFAGFYSSAQPAVCDYAYMRNAGIYVYSIANKQQYLISAKGQDPAISPDGTKLAYTDFGRGADRFIVLYNLATKKKITLDTHNSNCYGAVWSPDGKMLAYNTFLGDKWDIAVINVDNTGAKLLGKNAEQSYSPVWTPDGKSIIVQDASNLKFIDLSGNIVRTISLAKLEGGIRELKDMVGSSSSDRFIFTVDNSKIVFSSDTNEPGGSGEPPGAVFVYDTVTGKTMRLSPKGYDAGEVALSGNKVLFGISKINSMHTNVGEEDLDGKNYKILFTGCMSVSAKK